MACFVRLLASRRHGTLDLGVTNNLGRRVWEHKTKTYTGFSAQYGVDRLVWYEADDRVVAAIAREKAMKTWRRDWKLSLMEADPNWIDLYPTLNQ